ncbi:hypothetical protein C477_19959 [Haloterrigena salina JCM 13891]|uniref:Uncharacterized protein n=1 Tax=Haloterrigena salina JCM 13891 TaxID=1227488 RepID=M0BUI3_9EURY|nr:hypothetical protein C477_19959 [Haloterrigena salina JCM 13891]
MAEYAAERCADCNGKQKRRADGSIWCPNCALFRPTTPKP